ncbi:MAG: MarR family transcriptional regulator [Proteobacteria bacterium]|nr:MAG: MarR family transcriptional regulator [Pseudomonadota bacterium]
MKKKSTVPLKLDSMLCFTLYSTSLAMSKAYRPLLKDWGLTYPQYLVLIALGRKDGITISSLGEELFLDSGTLTPLLKRMESTKLLVRRRSIEDERQVLVSLTTKGQELSVELNALPHEIHESTGFSVTEMKALTSALTKVRSSLLSFQESHSEED